MFCSFRSIQAFYSETNLLWNIQSSIHSLQKWTKKKLPFRNIFYAWATYSNINFMYRAVLIPQTKSSSPCFTLILCTSTTCEYCPCIMSHTRKLATMSRANICLHWVFFIKISFERERFQRKRVLNMKMREGGRACRSYWIWNICDMSIIKVVEGELSNDELVFPQSRLEFR